MCDMGSVQLANGNTIERWCFTHSCKDEDHKYTRPDLPNNIYLDPFAWHIVRGEVERWCKMNPMPEVFDGTDSWHFNIAAMHDFLSQLNEWK